MADLAAASALFRRLDRELWVVTAEAGGRRGGLVATTVVPASIAADAPRVLVMLAHQHHTWELVRDAGAFGLHLLDEGQLDWVWRFGLGSGRVVDKLDGLATRPGASGAPLLVDSAGWLDCRVEAHFDTGDRAIVLAEVLDARAPGPGPILTVQRMLERATPERRAALAEELRRDADVDALAIQQWRKRISPHSSGEWRVGSGE